MTNFGYDPNPAGQIIFSKLTWSASTWGAQLQVAWAPSHLTDLAPLNKNSVLLGLDENYAFTLSTSDGNPRYEDCALAVWEVSNFTPPTHQGDRARKNHDGKYRNCVHPKINQDGSDLWVNVVIEYM